MDYSIDDICEKVNKVFDLYEDTVLEDGEDIFRFILFQHHLYGDCRMEIKDLTEENQRLKDELVKYKRNGGD